MSPAGLTKDIEAPPRDFGDTDPHGSTRFTTSDRAAPR
jgi:hypothetical protein